MTLLFYPIDNIGTAGYANFKTMSTIDLKTKSISGITDGFTDTYNFEIKTSALNNNLSEDEAYKLIEKVRAKLPMNR